MGTLVFVCPTTGYQVSTGIEVDRSSFKGPEDLQCWTDQAVTMGGEFYRTSALIAAPSQGRVLEIKVTSALKPERPY